MKMKPLTKILLQCGIVVLAIIMAIPTALAANKGANPVQLKIKYVYVDFPQQCIFIEGINFTKAKNIPIVTVGDMQLEIYNNHRFSRSYNRHFGIRF